MCKMKLLVILAFLLCSCSRLEYPIVTRYRECKTIKQRPVKERKHTDKTPCVTRKSVKSKLSFLDLGVFVVGSAIGGYLILERLDQLK